MRVYFTKLSEDKRELSRKEKEYLREIEKGYETKGGAVLFARVGDEISFVFPMSRGSRFLSMGRVGGEVDEYETDKTDEELIEKGIAGNSSLY